MKCTAQCVSIMSDIGNVFLFIDPCYFEDIPTEDWGTFFEELWEEATSHDGVGKQVFGDRGVVVNGNLKGFVSNEDEAEDNDSLYAVVLVKDKKNGRNTDFFLQHTSIQEKKPSHFEYIGEVTVDSGQLLVIPLAAMIDWKGCYFCDRSEEKVSSHYEEVCNVTQSEIGFGEVVHYFGFAFTPYFGDGMYSVFADLDEDGDVVSMHIVLTEEEIEDIEYIDPEEDD